MKEKKPFLLFLHLKGDEDPIMTCGFMYNETPEEYIANRKARGDGWWEWIEEKNDVMFLEWDEIQNEELKEFAMKYADKFTQIPD